MPAKPAGKGPVVKTKAKKFTLDLSVCVDDKIIDPADFEKYLSSKWKVAGKAGKLGDAVKIERSGSIVTVTAASGPKRYLKYLGKRYLKQNHLRDYLRILHTSTAGYEMRYFKLGKSAAEGEE